MKRRLSVPALATVVVLILNGCGDRPAPAPVITNDPGDPRADVAPAAPVPHTLDLPAPDATTPVPR